MGPAILILGSGPDVVRCRNWDLSPFSAIVAMNNAWRVREDWDYCIFPDDFPGERRPQWLGPDQTLIMSDEYVPSQNRFGGVVYAGATMAFTTAYWALDAFQPSLIAFLGCDMVYPKTGTTHFYGSGTADPLRVDPTLQDLTAKALRLQALAELEGCRLTNLSDKASRLPYPRSTVQTVGHASAAVANPDAVRRARDLEDAYDIRVPSGRYWEDPSIDAAKLAEIDALWLETFTRQVAAE